MSTRVPSKAWMKAPTLSTEYIEGARSFIKFTQNSLGKNIDWYCCPCVDCGNQEKRSAEDIFYHLIRKGITSSYTSWVQHGERSSRKNVNASVASTSTCVDNEEMLPRMVEMVNDTFAHSQPNDLDACLDEVDEFHDEDDAHDSDKSLDDIQMNIHEDVRYKKLMEDALQPLYPSCEGEHSKLSATIELLGMKSRHRWSNNSFTQLLEFLKRILPDKSTLAVKMDSAKSMIKALRMKCEVIHACPNDCILYWGKDNEKKDSCPTCGASRWKPADESKPRAKPLPMKKLRYFPLTERLQKMYSVPWLAENMTWHEKSVPNQSHMRHPVDSSCWKSVNYRWSDFAAEPRNVRLGLATDGFNPFGNNNSIHSCWPVMIVPYNLPPSLCMRKEFVMLTLLIPSNPGDEIDVYLQPLIEELRNLWSKGAETYDSYSKNTFNMREILLWTIHDLPAYGHVSGHRTTGKYACPVCSEGIEAKWLTNGKKFSYMGCRKFLKNKNHPFRTQKSQFNRKEEHGEHPRRLVGSVVKQKMSKIPTVYGKVNGKKRKRGSNEVKLTAWLKDSIFFKLDYWEYLPVPHNLDVMHVEKNVADNLFSLIMNTSKSKDGMAARKDLKAMNIKKKLWPVKINGRLSYAKAPYCLSRSERSLICRTLHQLKVPIGYSANWKHNVNLDDFQLKSLKSHDYHILLQHLLPVLLMHAFKKHKPLRAAIRQFSLFFNVLCSKVICRAELEKIGQGVVESLCVFEKYFPPSFFVSMTHLVLHLAEEARICGPVRYRWMYPFERMMKTYKSYVGNPKFPEGCIVEQYLMDEAMKYCMEYIPSSKREIHKQEEKAALDDKTECGYPIDKKGKDYLLPSLQYQQARKWVLRKSSENDEWERKYKTYLQSFKCRGIHCRRVIASSEKEMGYIPWLRKQLEKEKMSKFKMLADGPSFIAKSYNSYAINGYAFCTYDSEANSTTQNSGVSMKAFTNFRASAKDKNLVEDEATYYGIIRQILELDYQMFKQVVFFCDWVRIGDKRNRCIVDPDTNMVYVNLSRWQRNMNEDDEPFILASEAAQVFYCKDLSRDNWHVVLHAPKRLNHDVDAYEDPLVFEAMANSYCLASALMGDIEGVEV